MGRWYARPVFFVADVNRAIDFYVGKIGFQVSWRYADPGAQVAQVAQGETEIILCTQWPAKNGTGMLFIELTADDFAALPEAFAARGVPFDRGHWGYPVLIVGDPDGNQLYFPDPEAPVASEPDG